MLTEPLPMYIYIETCFERKEVKAVTDTWRVETGDLKDVVMSYYKEMGIYSVTPETEVFIRNNITDLLQASPEIIKLVSAAERRERMMSRSRRTAD